MTATAPSTGLLGVRTERSASALPAWPGPSGACPGIVDSGARSDGLVHEEDRDDTVDGVGRRRYPRQMAQTKLPPIATRRNGRNHLSKSLFMGRPIFPLEV